MNFFRLLYVVPQWVLSAAIKLALFPISGLGVFLSVLGDGWRRTPPMWRWCADGRITPKAYYSRWGVFWYWAVRNPVKVMALKQPRSYKQIGDIDESLPGVQWRYRYSKYLDSFRIVWGAPRADKGKREFYIGWKIGSPSPNKFTIQLRF